MIAALGPRADVRRYDKGYHMLLRDLEGPAVNKDVADWVLARTGDPAPRNPISLNRYLPDKPGRTSNGQHDRTQKA